MLLRKDNRLLVFFEILKPVFGPVAIDIFFYEVHESYRGQGIDIDCILNFGKISKNGWDMVILPKKIKLFANRLNLKS